MERKAYKMNIAGCDRALPLCPLNENLNIGAFVIFGDPELTTACAEALNARAPQHDVMITAESKGIPLICEMARLQGNKRYVLARKGVKLYMKDVLDVEVRSITTDHVQHLYLDGDYAAFGKVTEGIEVVDEITKVHTSSQDRPIVEQRMAKVTVDTFGETYTVEKYGRR